MSPSTEIALHVLWGSNPEDDNPDTFTFPTEAAKVAFIKGINEAEDWLGVTWVDHANYTVDEDGEVVEGARPRALPAPTDVFAMWGENPEEGQRPEAYTFATVEEAEAFKQGADACVGWTAWVAVPSADYRQVDDTLRLDELDRYTWLTVEGRAHLVRLMKADGLPETIYADPQGRWVDEGGEPGEAPAEPTRSAPRRAPR